MTHSEWLDAAAKDMAAFTELHQRACHDWLAALLATRPAPGRAEVEKAVAAYRHALLHHDEMGGCDPDDCAVHDEEIAAARTALLALYAEPQGEVYEVSEARITPPPTAITHQNVPVAFPVIWLTESHTIGIRVRVVRVAE